MTTAPHITITYDGSVAAAAGATRFVLAPAIERLPDGHPTKRFVAFMCIYARDTLTGRLPGPYSDADGEAFARRALVDPEILKAHAAASDHELAELVGIPLEQLAAARAELTPGAGNVAGARTPLSLVRDPSRSEQLRHLWSMTATQRVAAMRRGELTLEQCFAWAARHPDEIPTIGGVLEFLAGDELELAS